ncbi:hypothetical protein [Mycobacterium paraterrae]|uniref:Uncharacterized protein n=1 Tax=Mycobacterium paraterrae TaxID=577492 RepID=A0ABY3VQM8_9MYCO|nr:hypothetical protein [Mycobacterium paraterrae]UMB71762.1 hypothetical protein MKK62_11360 [Mycobacterium paraterrae]
MTKEHVFRQSWRGSTVDISFVPRDHPLYERNFTRYNIDGSIRSAHPDPVFELTVKGVCSYCNNGWMNRLDSVVEPWVFDPYAEESQCDPVQFRRWAIKIALLRSHREHRLVPQPGDLRKLYDGDDIADWRIFVGRMALPTHSHIFVGFGPTDNVQGGRLFGITQVSWSLGHTIVIALRLAEKDLAPTWFKMFKRANLEHGILVAEVLPTAKRLPSLETLPELLLNQVESLTWFYSTNPASPIHEWVRRVESGFRQAAEDAGVPVREHYGEA